MALNKWLMLAPVAGALGIGAGFGADILFAANEAKQDLKPAVSLPITRVELFNSPSDTSLAAARSKATPAWT